MWPVLIGGAVAALAMGGAFAYLRKGGPTAGTGGIAELLSPDDAAAEADYYEAREETATEARRYPQPIGVVIQNAMAAIDALLNGHLQNVCALINRPVPRKRCRRQAYRTARRGYKRLTRLVKRDAARQTGGGLARLIADSGIVEQVVAGLSGSG